MNSSIHRNIDKLPRSMQLALDEVEKNTGFFGLLLVGGVVPQTGEIRTHM